jgi:hypothetical protein
MKAFRLIISVFIGCCPAIAQAYDWSVVAKVRSIEVSYIPTNVPFTIDQSAGTCAAGTILKWNIHGTNGDEKSQNSQAILAALMTAQAAGRTITIYGNNVDCTVDYLYINA